MKKLISIIMAAMMALISTVALAEGAEPDYTTVELDSGVVYVYDFGDNRLHAYASEDALEDVCYAVESAEGVVLIESTAFDAGNAQWQSYIEGLGKDIAGKLMAYHPNGSDVYGEQAPYATENALANWGEGGSILALTDGFVASFGEDVAEYMPSEAQIVEFGDVITLAGLEFAIRNEGDDAYGIEIPAINCVYIHMMGSSTHNILTGVEHIDAFKAELEGFDFDLVLTSHALPEGREAVATKVAYLTRTREIAEGSSDAASFIAAMNQAFPEYSGVNYLEMTAGFLFPTAE